MQKQMILNYFSYVSLSFRAIQYIFKYWKMMEAKDIEVMLCHILGDEKDISKITVWKAESANICNVASSPTSAKIEYLSQQKPDLHVFLKGCLEGTMADTLNKALKLFDRETFFYTNVLPVYSQFLTKYLEKKNMFLEFYGLGKTTNAIYLLLQDFNLGNYTVTGKRDFHNIDVIKNVMKNLAIFHASYFHVDSEVRCKWGEFLSKSEVFLPCYRAYLENFFVGEFKKVLRVTQIISEEVGKGNEILKNHGIKSVSNDLLLTVSGFSNEIMNIFFKIATRRNDFSCLCHGDFHMWNIAISKESKENLKFFDYQAIRITTLVTDILQYLYQVSSPKFRQEHLMELLEIYCNEFNDFCRRSGIGKYLEKGELYKEYRYVSMWGFLYGFTFVLRRFIAEDFFDCINNVNSTKEVVLILKEKSLTNEIWDILNLYHDLINEAEEIGSFRYIKEILL